MSSKDSIEINKIIVTPEDIDAIIRKAIDSSFKILDYKLINPPEGSLGFSASHSHLKVNIQQSVGKTQETTKKTLEFFVKFFSYDNTIQTDYLTDSFFNKETFFYNTIIPLLISNYDIKKWSPACFLAKKDKIVLEDLNTQGYQISSTFFDDYELLKSALTTLASFHSGSILAEAHLNRDSEHPIPLNERFPDAFKETVFSREGFIKGWYDGGIDAACKIAEYLGRNPEDIREKFKRVPDIIKPSKSHCNAILHSDLWRSNVMFDNSQPLPNCLLIDFQTIRYGPMVLDLLHLLHVNSSPTFRAKFEKELVDHYHSVVEETIQRNNPCARIATRKEIELGLKEFRIFGCLIASLYSPITCLDSKIITTLGCDEKTFKDAISGDRTDLIFGNFEKDESYKIKIVNVITELAEIN